MQQEARLDDEMKCRVPATGSAHKNKHAVRDRYIPRVHSMAVFSK